MNIFLDDLRLAPDKYDLVFRSGEELVQWVINNPNEEIDLLSFDHDLGDGQIDGYDTVKQLVDLSVKAKKIQFHTDNFQGLLNMFWYLKNANKAGLLPTLRTLNPHKIECIDGIERVSLYFNALRRRS